MGRCSLASFFVSQVDKKAAFSTAQYPLRNSTLLDTASTIDITNEIAKLLNFRTAPPGDFLWAGDQKVPIQGYGDKDVAIDTPGGPSIMRFHGVALCENFACNLVSFRKLQRKGLWWDTRPEHNCLRRSDNSVLAYLKDRYDQFVLEDIPEDVSRRAFFIRRNKYNTSTQRKPCRALAEIWHLRLGHPGPQAIEHLVNCSKGVRIKGPTTVQCDQCGQAKIRRQKRRSSRLANKDPLVRGERLAIDFHDYEEDDQGYDSLMLISDRCTGWSWDFYLKDRKAKTIITTLRYFFDFVAHQYDLKPKVVEADGEITSVKPKVKRYLEQERLLKVEPSPPYTQDLNGGAERSGGVIKEKSKAMTGELPTQLWREIVKAAVYLNNRTPKYNKGWKSPYERFFGRKPAQEHLKAYGCKAFAMTTDAKKKANRLKRLNPKAWIGYLLGYTSSNTYRIWIPFRKEVITTRDVIFNEYAIFNGKMEELENDVREVNLEDIAHHLQRISIPEIDQLPETENATAGHEDVSLFDLEDYSEGDEGSADQADKAEQDVQFDYLLTPPQTPPAALLAASIQTPLTEPSEPSEPTVQYGADPKEHLVWQAAFHAGTVGNAVAKVDGQIYDRAKILRLLKSPRPRIHRRNLPKAPARHHELADHPMGYLFEQAELDHLKSHAEMHSWTEILRSSIPKKLQVLDCMWVYVYKFDKHGRFIKCKARLVVRGDQQARSNKQDTYAATLAGRSFRTLIAIAARFDLELLQYDAVNAFVNADLDEEVYMKMPPGQRRCGTILRLNKALYGLRKSPLLWQRSLTAGLKEIGFKTVPHEPCCQTFNGILVFFYVDDIVFAFSHQEVTRAQGLVEALKNRYSLTGGGELQWFLGIEILRDRKRRLIWLSQSSYIDKISGLSDAQPRCDSPMSKEELRPHLGHASLSEIHIFQVKVGSLLYAAVITRPDVAFAVSRLARFNCNPSPEHQIAADRVLCYLKRTRSLALQFGGADDFEVASDASFADNSIDRKSSQAYAMKLFGGLIGWRANKQSTVTTSTTEAELLALSQAAKESLYMSRLFEELSISLDSSRIRIQCDNTQTIRLITEEIATLKTQLRHVDIHNHWLRQEVMEDRIEVVYTPSARLMADGLTKALQGPKFEEFVRQIGLVDIGAQLQEKKLEEMTQDDLECRIQQAFDMADCAGKVE